MRTLIALLCGLFLLAPQDPKPAPAAPTDVFAPFAPFLAHKAWTTHFPAGGLSDVQEYARMVDGKFLRNVHRVSDEKGRIVYEGETVYGWDPAAKQFRWWYFNSTGGWIDGTATVEKDGTLVFDGDNHGGPGQTARVRSSASFDAQGKLHAKTWFSKDGDWKLERELVYEPGG